MAEADLHDALEDAKQIPVITDGIERIGGSDYSLAALAAPTCDATFRATSFDVVVRKRRTKILENLLKFKSIAKLPTTVAQGASSQQSFDSRRQRNSAPSTRSSNGASRCACFVLCSRHCMVYCARSEPHMLLFLCGCIYCTVIGLLCFILLPCRHPSKYPVSTRAQVCHVASSSSALLNYNWLAHQVSVVCRPLGAPLETVAMSGLSSAQQSVGASALNSGEPLSRGAAQKSESAVLEAASPAPHESEDKHSRNGSYVSGGGAAQSPKGRSSSASSGSVAHQATHTDTAPVAAELQHSPGELLSEDSHYSVGSSLGQECSTVDSSADEISQAAEEVQRMSVNSQRLEHMLAQHRNPDEKDPFLTAWCASALYVACLSVVLKVTTSCLFTLLEYTVCE